MPKVVDKQEKRARILQAAVRVFAEKGISGTKILDIAEAADIGKGTVYEYFHSKEEIITARFHFFMGQVEKSVGARLLHLDDPLDRLLAYFSAWGEIIESDLMSYIEVLIDFWAAALRQERDCGYPEFKRDVSRVPGVARVFVGGVHGSGQDQACKFPYHRLYPFWGPWMVFCCSGYWTGRCLISKKPSTSCLARS